MQRCYGLDLANTEDLDRLTWRKLNVLVAALPADSSLASALARRRKAGDVVPDQVLETDAEADDFWRRRAGRQLRGGVH